MRKVSRLPNEYQEVEYIESDGNQYINLGKKGTEKTRIIIDCYPTLLTGTHQLAGDITTSSSAISCNFATNLSNVSRFGDKSNSGIFNILTLERHTVIISNDGYYLDNNLLWIPNASNFETTSNISIIGATGSSSRFNGKIYSCKVYENNVLVRNLIPCYNRSNNEIGMFDLINKDFYTNSGTGAFNKGNNINTLKEVGFRKVVRLPQEYQEVEYIASDGNQYIKTGIILDNNSRIKTTFKFNVISYSRIMGAWASTSSDRFSIGGATSSQGNVYSVGYGNSGSVYPFGNITTNWNECDFNKNVWTMNNIAHTFSEQTFTGLECVLFGVNVNGEVTSSANCSFKETFIYSNNVLVRDMIPCYRKLDNVIGMFDLVNKVFYTNQGTGTFTKGADHNTLVNIDKIMTMVNGQMVCVFEQGFTREQEGVPPLTTTKECIGKPLKDYKIYGNSIQDGTPTPQAPIEIESVGDKTNNLLDLSKAAIRAGVCELMPDGLKIINSYANLTFARLSDFCKPNTTYYIHAEKITDKTLADNVASASIRNVGYLGVLLKPTETDATFTTGDTVNGALYCYGFNDAEVYFKNLYIGEVPYTEYEPYSKYKIPVTARGKNLINISSPQSIGYGTGLRTGVPTNQIFTTTGDYILSYHFEGDDISSVNDRIIYGGETYRFNFVSKTNNTKVQKLTVTDEMLETLSTISNVVTINFYAWSSDSPLLCSNFQIEKSSVATSYEPYFNQTKDIYLNEPLRKVNNFVDYLDFKNQRVVRYVDEITYSGQTISTDYMSSTGGLDTGATVDFGLLLPQVESVTLPSIPSAKAVTIYSTSTTVLPSKIYIKYKSK